MGSLFFKINRIGEVTGNENRRIKPLINILLK